jgi:hypothetical protein
MPLQNRVDPFGAIQATSARGMFTGNRGVIHDPATKTLLKRRWTTKAWIICDCAYGERKRDVMGRNTPSGKAGWTELFFLDEVTALAAGHRPCFFCRREKAKEFADCFAAGQGRRTMSAPEMDAILHGERWASGGKASALAIGELEMLPDGVMVASGHEALAVRDGKALRWTFEGYGQAMPLAGTAGLRRTLLTPPASVGAIRHGYRPEWCRENG